MKKIILTMVAVLFTMTAFAGSDLKVKSGDKKFFKTTAGTATVEINFDGATYDNKRPLEQEYKNLADLKKIAVDRFTENFNEKSKGLKVVTGNADYSIKIQVTKIDRYINMMSFTPGGNTKSWGTVTVYDKSNQPVIVIDFDGVDGGSNPSDDNSFGDSFDELAKQLTKLK